MADDRRTRQLRDCRIILALQLFIGILNSAVCVLNLTVELWSEAALNGVVVAATAVIHFGITRPRHWRLKLAVRDMRTAEQEVGVR